MVSDSNFEDDDERNEHGEGDENGNVYDDPYYIEAMIQIGIQETGSYW